MIITNHKKSKNHPIHDLIIIGGGIAGLALAIQMSMNGRKVIVIEKNKYPFHRVCGEYVSRESKMFLDRIGVKLESSRFPVIKKLVVSSPSGKLFSTKMQTGGVGISRYTFDMLLKNRAEECGATVLDGTKVEDIIYRDNYSEIVTRENIFRGSVVAGTYGKRSLLDNKLNRKSSNHAKNYVGIKYHVKASLPRDVIELHNFKDGYCGISAVEDDKYCLCYLTTSENLKISGNNIERMENEILKKNPFLKNYLTDFPKLFSPPVSISQISFDAKTPVNDHVLMMGDSAGMITPLCGNGMSMAMNASVIAVPFIDSFLDGKINRAEMEQSYSKQWHRNFSGRLRTGRIIQSLFGNEKMTETFINLMNFTPGIANKLVNATHGKEF